MRKVENSANRFEDKGKGEDRLEDLPCVHAAFLREVRKQNGLVVESRMHAGEQDEHRRYSHDTETAKLHEHYDNPVPEMRKCAAYIYYGKPSDAHCRSRREKRLQKVDRLICCYLKVQEECAEDDQKQVAEHHERDGVRLFFCLEYVFGKRIRKSLVL